MYRLHNFNVRIPERGSLGTRLLFLKWHRLLEGLKKCEGDLLDVPSYGELLGEVIL